jgi:transitional endoplasmic reticulum ATPase
VESGPVARASGSSDASSARGATATDRDVLATLEESGGHEQAAVEVIHWDQVVLPGPVVSDIKTILRLLCPATAEQLGVPVPSGLVLVGRPGTGKTWWRD